MLEKLEELYDQIRNCENCQLKELCSVNSELVLGWGNESAQILFVARNPAEKRKGNLCFGEQDPINGRVFARLLSEVGLERNDVFATNLVKCSTPENRELESDEIDVCSSWLFDEMEIIQPRIIIAVGKQAAQFFKVQFG